MIFLHTLKSFFKSWPVYIASSSLLLLLGIAIHTHVLGERPKLVSVLMSDFFYVCSVLAMVAPILISIKVFAEPRVEGSDIWFVTSPHRASSILLQRFAAGLVFFGFLLCLSSYFPLYLIFSAGGSWMHFFSGCLGVLLLAAACLAIGTFFCSLRIPVWVSALLGLVTMFLLLLMWKFSSWVPDSLQDLVAFLSLHDQHFDGFRRGIIHSGSLVYYLGLVSAFLIGAHAAARLRRGLV